MRKIFLLVLAIAAAYFGYFDRLEKAGDDRIEIAAPLARKTDNGPRNAKTATSDELQNAFANHRSNVQIQANGVVEKVLSDDSDGSRHQRFIVKLPSGQTVLIAHNIDLAPRVDSLKAGDALQFSGEYEWNDRGGVVHWTHRDPANRHTAGWIKHGDRTYQ
jgi:Protein of unknown function (DUF3465)